MTYYIYKLVDPRTNKPFYVGMTNNPKHRFNQHLSIYHTTRIKEAIIQEIRAQGFHPIMEISEEINEIPTNWKEPRKYVKAREEYWIKKLVDEGFQLVNGTGNDQPFNRSTSPKTTGEAIAELDREWATGLKEDQIPNTREDLELYLTIFIASQVFHSQNTREDYILLQGWKQDKLNQWSLEAADRKFIEDTTIEKI